ncbi:MAG: arginine--tRNA ligase [bacterium]|nr:arginine--tRNA ligase [bacterium]
MKKTIETILKKALGADAQLIAPEVTIQEHPEFGHYSTNVALPLAKSRNESPRILAGAFAAMLQLKAPKGFFSRIEVAGPGFINMWITPGTTHKEFARIYKTKKTYGNLALGKGKKVIVEYSQPNIAKRMHVGHLRSTIIGDALANIHEAAGYKVTRWNYLGDWGTQFGKLIAAYKRWGKKGEVQKDPIGTLLALYVRFHEEIKDHPELEIEGAQEFKKLEDGDKENRALWKWFRELSLKEFYKIYKTLGIEFDVEVGESAYEKELSGIVKELQKKGIAKKSEGAIVVPIPSSETPALIQKSDGASLYLTRDLATLRDRLKKYKPVKILYVVANEQTFHFSQLFHVAGMLGWGKATELQHVKFGMMLGEDGKKFSTREGKGIALEELIGKIVVLARKVVEEKNTELSKKKKDVVAHAVGIGALKYNDLHENRNSDITFDWERMLDFAGDSAPYLQYTYARLRSILRKAPRSKVKGQWSMVDSDIELALMRHLFVFPDEIEKSTETLYTNNIAKYLYELAGHANKFYATTPMILKDENVSRRAARLALIEMVAVVLKRGLGLLGIEAPEEI